MKYESIYQPQVVRVERTEQLTENEKLFELAFTGQRKSLGHLPGQFIQVSLLGIGEAPISISSSPTRGENFELVVRKVGNFTQAMHQLQAGGTVGIRGPFGTHFPVEEARGKDVLFVAGGIGMVPMRSFIQYVLDNRDEYGRVIVFYGCKMLTEQLFLPEVKEWRSRRDVEIVETLDQACPEWHGHVGVITTCFAHVGIDPENTICALCGPPVMYKFCLMEARGKGIPDDNIYLSLERRMKCGVGLCGHCQINHLYVCQDGPVFCYTDIRDLEEAIT